MWNLVGFQVESMWNLVRLQVESMWNLVRLGSAWIQVNLVGMVGIWLEFGWSPGQIWVCSD